MTIETQQEEYWENRYAEGRTGWDMKHVSPPLQHYIDGITDKELKILIPGCGNAYEADYLLDQGFTNITLLDISGTLVRKLAQHFRNTSVQIIHGNFFELKGQYDLILEQTFFCSFPPELRKHYVPKTFELLCPAGIVAGVLFNKPVGTESPPYTARDDEYRRLFEPFFHFLVFEPCKTSILPRLAKEVFFEFRKKEIESSLDIPAPVY